MQKALLIAEKPDLMRKIQAVYEKYIGNLTYKIVFAAQRGHLVTLKLPHEIEEDRKNWKWENLPFHPEDHGGWQYKLCPDTGTSGKYMTTQERFEKIKEEIRSGNYDFVIHAGDPDQEGELLVRLVLEYVNNKLPVKRFWTNDLTEKHILKALKDLRDDDNDPVLQHLLDAAKARQHSDYRYGMNISEAATLRMQSRVACGRVKTPLLAIVVRRENEIRNFVPRTEYGVKAIYDKGFGGQLCGGVNDDEENDNLTWFDTKQEAADLINRLGNTAIIKSYKTERKETLPPKLFKLATLQIEAGKLGYNDRDTLKIIQGLYEKELLSYPRTDCEYLSSDEDFIGILRSLLPHAELAPFVKTVNKEAVSRVRKTKKWVNDKALEDAGHSAIRPTTKPATGLTEEESDIYMLVARRFVSIFLSPLVQDQTTVITDIDNKNFISRGKRLISKGYTELLKTEFKDQIIPELQENELLRVKEYELAEKTSVCPQRYTSPDLIAVCENPAKFLEDKSLKKLGKRLSIGTPATRSSIIRQLISVDHYLKEQKKGKKTYLIPTQKGEQIIENLADCAICKVDMTGYWEERLEMVRQGKLDLASLESEMRQNVDRMILEIRDAKMNPIKAPLRKEVGTCPNCGEKLIEGDKNIYCRGYKNGCKISLFKNINGARFTGDEFIQLLSGKVLEKKMKAKNSGRTYQQKVRWDAEECRLAFIQGQRRTQEQKKTEHKCPICDEPLYDAGAYLNCKACDFRLWKIASGVTLTEEDIDDLCTGMITRRVISGMTSKSGKTFSARIKIDTENKKTIYEFA